MTTDLLSPLPWCGITLLAAVAFILPLLSFLLNIIAARRYAWQGSLSACFFLIMASFIALILLFNVWEGDEFHTRFTWFALGGLNFTVGLFVDVQSALMAFVVTFVSLLVHLYSTSYMKDDPGYQRYFAFLGLFTFSMLGIVLADNLLVIFIFWELVGLSSWLLIGHWYHKEKAARAAKKAFIINRIGDAGFIIGIAILWEQFNTLDIVTLKTAMADSTIEGLLWLTESGGALNIKWLTIMGVGLFMGAVGKSAQFPLQTWLPDAMEGPTPVSALIHAATMVAAGVFLMCRVVELLNIDTMTIIAVTGGITAFMGAVAALAQHDIKRVLAYSTISQLGYMFMGVGIGAWDAALFHLFTHAFFKAALFLAAGSVIYALHEYTHRHNLTFDAQDMRNMGGLGKKLPVTFSVYLVGTLALMGVPLFSGFLSKDALLSASFGWSIVRAGHGHMWAYLVPVLGYATVVLTALYMARQVLLIFFGSWRGAEHPEGLTESSGIMKLTLIVLAVMSTGLVWSLNPLDFNVSWFLDHLTVTGAQVPDANDGWLETARKVAFENHAAAGIASVALVVLGAGYGWWKYRPGSSYVREYNTFTTTSTLAKISYNNWYLDSLYLRIMTRPVMTISKTAARVERSVIDRFVDLSAIINVIFAHIVGWFDRTFVDGFVNFSVFFAGRVGVLAKSFQYGKVQNYIIVAVLSILLIILLIL